MKTQLQRLLEHLEEKTSGQYWDDPMGYNAFVEIRDWITANLSDVEVNLANRVANVVGLIGNVDHSAGNGPNASKYRGILLNSIREILTAPAGKEEA